MPFFQILAAKVAKPMFVKLTSLIISSLSVSNFKLYPFSVVLQKKGIFNNKKGSKKGQNGIDLKKKTVYCTCTESKRK